MRFGCGPQFAARDREFWFMGGRPWRWGRPIFFALRLRVRSQENRAGWSRYGTRKITFKVL